ncbi:MAG: AAA family ATPase [Bacteroidales bacterium]|nr:AAA family ATPase [Bacteroidales bacterium]
MDNIKELLNNIKNKRYTRVYKYSWSKDTIDKAKAVYKKIAEAYGMNYVEPKELQQFIEYSFNPDYENKEKGILLIGSTGVGKTMLMQMFMDFVSVYPIYISHNNDLLNARMIKRTAQEIANYYKENGEIEEMLERFVILWIDDMGSEDVVNHFGNKRNVIEDLIFTRAERGLYTFATTNISKFSDIYGDRTVSRMNRMFFPVVMENKTDYRKL